MRVLQVVRPAAGGIRRHLEILTTGLIERGIQTQIAAPPDFQLESPARIIPIPIQSRPHPIRDLRAATAAAVAASKVDLIHGHGLRGAWIACLAARKSGKPFIFTAHNLAPIKSGTVGCFLVRYTIKRAAGIIAVSQAVADSMIAQFGKINRSRLHVIPGGIDLGAFDRQVDVAKVRQSLGVPFEALLVVSMGRLAPEKGFDQLIMASGPIIAEIEKENKANGPNQRPVHFIIAGDGDEKPKLQKMIDQWSDRTRFKLAGYWPDAPSLMKAADLVVVPSIEEGQGLVALEAMAASKPVVATRVGGLGETVVDGITGSLTLAGDPFKSLGRAILKLLQDDDARQRMGEAGRARVEQLYTAPVMIDRTIQLYRRLVP